MSDTITHATLTKLVEANAVRSAALIGQPGGWSILVKYGMTERALSGVRGHMRTWRHLDSAVKYLRALGLARFDVDASNYSRDGLMVQRRPDKAAMLREAHAAKTRLHYLEGKVTTARGDARPALPHDQAMAEAEGVLSTLTGGRSHGTR